MLWTGKQLLLVIILPLIQHHYPQIAEIYQQGIDSGIATFETKVPVWDLWDGKYHPFSRLGIFQEDLLMGWAALSPVSKRQVYAGVAEVSVYVRNISRGKGFGFYLLRELIDSSERNAIYSLQSSIFRENVASINLHLKCGFRKIGYKERIAQRSGIWYDNILMERRSERYS